ncbi:MAG: IS110 family transposase [Bacteroidetes bacterium]|nr:IS110 family transposase [Bacteroidota bacterium]
MTSSVTASPPKLFIGIDIHKNSWKVHFCTDLFDGDTVSFTPGPRAFKEYVDRHFPNHLVSCVYEAGCCGYSAARAFQSYGWKVLVVNPADVPRPAKQAWIKTDKIDCINLAKQLKNNQLQSITIPSVQREQFRALFRRRFDLIKDFRRVKSHIKSFLLYHGIEIPEAFDNPNWSHAFINWMIDLQWDFDSAQKTIDSLIFHYRFLNKEIQSVSNDIRAYCRKHYKKDYYLLQSIPGIGPLTSAAFLAEAGDLRQFKSLKKFAAFVGLIPGVYQSGETAKTLGMTPRANHILRSYMVEAAWVAIRKDPVMQAYYRKHLGKNPKSIVIKVARKLLSRVLAVIKTETPYQIGMVA